MATFTISLAGSAVINGSKSWTISDADVTNLINYLNFTYAPLANGTALVAWAQGFVTRTISDVKNFMQLQNPPASIVFT